MNVDRFLSTVSIYNLPKTLKTEQKEIIEVISAGKNSVITVLPTGYGKFTVYAAAIVTRRRT